MDYAKTQVNLLETVRRNNVIANFPANAMDRLVRNAHLIELSAGQELCPCGSGEFCYFPIHSVVSLQIILHHGKSVEVALIGHEGMLDLFAFMGGYSATINPFVQHSGLAFRIRTVDLLREFNTNAFVNRILLCYAQSVLSQIAQNTACNSFHKLDQRLCRWLLLMFDRLPSNKLTVTQEGIATVLGVRREGITGAAAKLQADSIIEYRRGQIRLLNRAELKKRACECYETVNCEYKRLLT